MLSNVLLYDIFWGIPQITSDALDAQQSFNLTAKKLIFCFVILRYHDSDSPKWKSQGRWDCVVQYDCCIRSCILGYRGNIWFFMRYRTAAIVSGVSMGYIRNHIIILFSCIWYTVIFQDPFVFSPYHKAMREPFDYYMFGQNYIRPLVDFRWLDKFHSFTIFISYFWYIVSEN